MSISNVRDVLNNVLINKEPTVIAIKGAWGCGKTTFWEKTLSGLVSNKLFKFSRYSYVSLFGISTLEDLRYSIFENCVPESLVGESPNITTYLKNKKDAGEVWFRKATTFISNAKGLSASTERVAYFSVRDSLICIDDLERKGKGLDLNDVLGLVSQLKLRKGCTVVLLLNDNQDVLEPLLKHKDKVVDIDLSFSPTSEECFDIAFKEDDIFYNAIKKYSINLNIKNIRILHRIKNFMLDIKFNLHPYSDQLKNDAVKCIVLFTWIVFSQNDGAPALSMINKLKIKFYTPDFSEEEKAWWNRLVAYGIERLGALELAIYDGVVNGFFDKPLLDLCLESEQKRINKINANNSFNDAWKRFYRSFDDDVDELKEELISGAKSCVYDLSPSNLNSTVILLKELGDNNAASDLIDYYIECRKNEDALFKNGYENEIQSVIDEEIIKKFEDMKKQAVQKIDPYSIFLKMALSKSWGLDDEKILAEAPTKTYVDSFKRLNEDTNESIKLCLGFESYANEDKNREKIFLKTKEALTIIAGESVLNNLRVKRYYKI